MNHIKRSKRRDRGGEGACSRSPAEWLAVHLDIPPDLWEGGMRIELRGRNTLTVYGCRKILDYCPEEIRFCMKGSILSVRGARLICTSYLSGAVSIDGRVDGIAFLEDGEVGA